jgi:hypothetical protein
LTKKTYLKNEQPYWNCVSLIDLKNRNPWGKIVVHDMEATASKSTSRIAD